MPDNVTELHAVSSDLIRDKNGNPIWCQANAQTMLKTHRDWDGVLGYNEFTRRRMILRGKGQRIPRELNDIDYIQGVKWFNDHGFPTASRSVTTDAMQAVCMDYTYDPLRDYIDGLEWDGEPRIDWWLTTYLGVAETNYSNEVGKRWLISAIARALKPGCKADCMLVLEGVQGAYKSSAIRALAGADWFSDSLPQMGTKDASSYLRGKWIVEVAELEAMRREADMIKAFISRQVEIFRPAYGREEVTEPRRCVFVGTTNKGDWLNDETGGRRFWPVKVGFIDLDAIRRDRDQLFAEAKHLFNQGEPWWLRKDIAEVAAEVVSDRAGDDPWRDDIERFVRLKDQVHTKAILTEMGIPIADMTPPLSKRVAGVLLQLGWERGSRATSGPCKGQIVFLSPNSVSERRG